MNEFQFWLRSWFSVVLLHIATFRMRSSRWLVELLGTLGSVVIGLLLIVGAFMYYLIRKWGQVA